MTENIKYGSAVYAPTGETQDLYLDYYMPPDSDSRSMKPAVVFIHGGGFKGGSKIIGRKLAEQLAMCGYAVFSISYRLTGDHWDPATQK